MKIVLDCDNTMGIPGCDVDDAMALLYLLNKRDAELLAITTTHGNNTIDAVYHATKTLLEDIGMSDIPLYKGSKELSSDNEAARQLVKLARENSGALNILAVGSLTNLNAAYQLDSDFFSHISQIVLMGGITENLIVGNKPMQELNFSVDYQSTRIVLSKAGKIATMTGNNCLATLFTREEFESNLIHTERGRYILEKTAYWFEHNEKDYGLQGFYNWDITSAIYLMRPDLFEEHLDEYEMNEELLKFGKLKPADNHTKDKAFINLPTIKDITLFKNEAYKILAGGEGIEKN